MNTLKIIVALLLFTTFNSRAQVSVNVNIGTPPVWASPRNVRVDYYFLPEIDAYYDVPAQRFIYISNGRWIRSVSLPYRYRNYDLYTGYKVVVNELRAYRHYQTHRQQYSRYRGNRSQVVIRNSHEEKYKRNRHDNGNGRGRGRN